MADKPDKETLDAKHLISQNGSFKNENVMTRSILEAVCNDFQNIGVVKPEATNELIKEFELSSAVEKADIAHRPIAASISEKDKVNNKESFSLSSDSSTSKATIVPEQIEKSYSSLTRVNIAPLEKCEAEPINCTTSPESYDTTETAPTYATLSSVPPDQYRSLPETSGENPGIILKIGVNDKDISNITKCNTSSSLTASKLNRNPATLLSGGKICLISDSNIEKCRRSDTIVPTSSKIIEKGLSNSATSKTGKQNIAILNRTDSDPNVVGSAENLAAKVIQPSTQSSSDSCNQPGGSFQVETEVEIACSEEAKRHYREKTTAHQSRIDIKLHQSPDSDQESVVPRNATGSYRASCEMRNTKARRVSAKMKKLWAMALQSNSFVSCPVVGCHQTYVTVANLQTHYKWCTGKKSLQHCSYCSSLIIADHDAVLHHMEVEHPDKLEEYKEKLPVREIPNKPLPDTTKDTLVIQDEHNNLTSKNFVGHRFHRKRHKINRCSKVKFRAKENILRPKKSCLKKSHKICEKKQFGYKRYKKSVRFDAVLQKINSVAKEPTSVKPNVTSQNISPPEGSFNQKIDCVTRVNESAEDFDLSTEELVDDPSEYPDNLTHKKSLTNVQLNADGYPIFDQCLKANQNLSECKTYSHSKNSPTCDKRSRPRVSLNNQGYQIFSEYLKLTRDWASERKTYSRSRNSSASDSPVVSTSAPKGIMDDHQLNIPKLKEISLDDPDKKLCENNTTDCSASVNTQNSQNSFPCSPVHAKATYLNRAKSKNPNALPKAVSNELGDHHTTLQDVQKSVEISTGDKSFVSEEISYATNQSTEQLDNAADTRCENIALATNLYKPLVKTRVTCYDNAVQRFSSPTKSPIALSSPITYGKTVPQPTTITTCSPFTVPDFDTLLKTTESPPSAKKRRGRPPKNRCLEDSPSDQLPKNTQDLKNKSKCIRQNGIKLPPNGVGAEGFVRRGRGRPKKNTLPDIITTENVPCEIVPEQMPSGMAIVKPVKKSKGKRKVVCTKKSKGRKVVILHHNRKPPDCSLKLNPEGQIPSEGAATTGKLLSPESSITQTENVTESIQCNKNGPSTKASVIEGQMGNKVAVIISPKPNIIVQCQSLPQSSDIENLHHGGRLLKENESKLCSNIPIQNAVKLEHASPVKLLPNKPSEERDMLSELKEVSTSVQIEPMVVESTSADVQHLENVPKKEFVTVAHVPIVNSPPEHFDNVNKVEKNAAHDVEISTAILPKEEHCNEVFNELKVNTLVVPVTEKSDIPQESENKIAESVENATFKNCVSSSVDSLAQDNSSDLVCKEEEEKVKKSMYCHMTGSDKLTEIPNSDVENNLKNSNEVKDNALTDHVTKSSLLVECCPAVKHGVIVKSEPKVVEKSNILEKIHDTKCIVQSNLNSPSDSLNMSYEQGHEIAVPTVISHKLNNIEDLPQNDHDMNVVSNSLNITNAPVKKRGRPKKLSVDNSLRVSTQSATNSPTVEKLIAEVSILNLRNVELQNLSNSSNCDKSECHTECSLPLTGPKLLIQTELKDGHVALDAEPCVKVEDSVVTVNADNSTENSSLNDGHSTPLPKKRGRKRGSKAVSVSTPELTPLSDSSQVVGRRTSTRNRKIKRYDSDEDIYQGSKVAVKESSKKTKDVKIQETPRKRGRPRKHPIKEVGLNCEDMLNKSSVDNSTQCSNSERGIDLINESQGTSTFHNDSHGDSSKHSTRKCSRKGRPRKCVRYADLNSGIDSDTMEDSSSTLDLLYKDANKSTKKMRLDKKVVDQEGLLTPKSADGSAVSQLRVPDSLENGEKESENGYLEGIAAVRSESEKERFVKKLDMISSRKISGACGKVISQSSAVHSKVVEKDDKVLGKKRKRVSLKSSSAKSGEINLFTNEETDRKDQGPGYAGDLDTCERYNVDMDVSGETDVMQPSKKRRATRRAAVNARKKLVHLIDSDKTEQTNAQYSGKESSDDDYNPTIAEIKEKDDDEEENEPVLLKESSSIDHIKKKLAKYQEYYHAPEVRQREVTPELLKKWCSLLDKRKKIICENEGCGKALETKLGMIYHYKNAPCQKANERWKCLICDKILNPGHRLMLRHLLKFHFKEESPFPSGTTRKSSPVLDLNGIESTMEFHRKYYFRDLMPDWKPRRSLWKLQSFKDYEPYLPPSKTSVSVKIENIGKNSASKETNWFKLNCFGSIPAEAESSHCTIFAGGPIMSAAWCPTPVDVRASQYIALATADTMEPDNKLLETKVGNGLLQIWKFGMPESIICSIKPVFSIGISHQHGIVHDMAWCPSGCWEKPSKDCNSLGDILPRLGLLAVACADSCIRIYSIPHPNSLNCTSKNLPIFSSQASVVLQAFSNGPCLSTTKSMCTSVSWQRTDKCELVAGGFSNGMICVWHLTNTSPLLAVSYQNFQSVLIPFLSFQGHISSITGLSFAPLYGGRWIASCGLDLLLKTWDLEDTCMPVSIYSKGNMRCLQWISHWNGHFVAKYNNDPSSIYKEFGYYKNPPCNLTLHNSPVLSTSVSEWLNSVASCDIAGEVSGISLGCLLKPVDHQKQMNDRRFPIFRVEYRLLDEPTSCIPESPVKKLQCSPSISDTNGEVHCPPNIKDITSVTYEDNSIAYITQQVLKCILERIDVEDAHVNKTLSISESDISVSNRLITTSEMDVHCADQRAGNENSNQKSSYLVSSSCISDSTCASQGWHKPSGSVNLQEMPMDQEITSSIHFPTFHEINNSNDHVFTAKTCDNDQPAFTNKVENKVGTGIADFIADSVIFSSEVCESVSQLVKDVSNDTSSIHLVCVDGSKQRAKENPPLDASSIVSTVDKKVSDKLKTSFACDNFQNRLVSDCVKTDPRTECGTDIATLTGSEELSTEKFPDHLLTSSAAAAIATGRFKHSDNQLQASTHNFSGVTGETAEDAVPRDMNASCIPSSNIVEVTNDILTKVAGKEVFMDTDASSQPRDDVSPLCIIGVLIKDLVSDVLGKEIGKKIALDLSMSPRRHMFRTSDLNDVKEVVNGIVSDVSKNKAVTMNICMPTHPGNIVSRLNVVREIVKDIVFKVSSKYRDTSAFLGPSSQTAANTIPDSSVIEEVVKDIVTDVSCKDGVHLNLGKLIKSSHVDCGLNVISEIVKEIVSEVISKYKDTSVSLGMLQHANDNNAHDSNVVEEMVKNIVSKVVSNDYDDNVCINLGAFLQITTSRDFDLNVVGEVIDFIVSEVSRDKGESVNIETLHQSHKCVASQLDVTEIVEDIVSKVSEGNGESMNLDALQRPDEKIPSKLDVVVDQGEDNVPEVNENKSESVAMDTLQQPDEKNVLQVDVIGSIINDIVSEISEDVGKCMDIDALQQPGEMIVSPLDVTEIVEEIVSKVSEDNGEAMNLDTLQRPDEKIPSKLDVIVDLGKDNVPEVNENKRESMARDTLQQPGEKIVSQLNVIGTMVKDTVSKVSDDNGESMDIDVLLQPDKNIASPLNVIEVIVNDIVSEVSEDNGKSMDIDALPQPDKKIALPLNVIKVIVNDIVSEISKDNGESMDIDALPQPDKMMASPLNVIGAIVNDILSEVSENNGDGEPMDIDVLQQQDKKIVLPLDVIGVLVKKIVTKISEDNGESMNIGTLQELDEKFVSKLDVIETIVEDIVSKVSKEENMSTNLITSSQGASSITFNYDIVKDVINYIVDEVDKGKIVTMDLSVLALPSENVPAFSEAREIVKDIISKAIQKCEDIYFSLDNLSQAMTSNIFDSDVAMEVVKNLVTEVVSKVKDDAANLKTAPQPGNADIVSSDIIETLEDIVSSVISKCEDKCMNIRTWSEETFNCMCDTNDVNEVIKNVLTSVACEKEALAVNLDASLQQSIVSDLSVANETVQDIVSKVISKYEDVSVNDSTLPQENEISLPYSNIVNEVVKDLVTEVASDDKGAATNLDVLPYQDVLRLNIIEDTIRNIVSKVMSKYEDASLNISMLPSASRDIQEVINNILTEVAKKEKVATMNTDVSSQQGIISDFSIAKEIMEYVMLNVISKCENISFNIGMVPQETSIRLPYSNIVLEVIKDIVTEVVSKDKDFVTNFGISLQPNNILELNIIKGVVKDIISKVISIYDTSQIPDLNTGTNLVFEAVCRNEDMPVNNAVPQPANNQSDFSDIRETVECIVSNVNSYTDVSINLGGLTQTANIVPDSNDVEFVNDNLTKIVQSNEVMSMDVDNSNRMHDFDLVELMDSIKDEVIRREEQITSANDQADDNSVPLERYDAMSRKYGLILKDVDLCDFRKIPESEFCRLRRRNSLTAVDPEKYPLSSVNVTQWNPNYGSHFWLFTGCQSGIARLSFLSGLPRAERTGFWSSRRSRKSTPNNR